MKVLISENIVSMVVHGFLTHEMLDVMSEHMKNGFDLIDSPVVLISGDLLYTFVRSRNTGAVIKP